MTFSTGSDASRAVHAIAEIGQLIEAGRFSLPVAQTFPLAEIAQAHRVSEDGHVRGKVVVVVGGRGGNERHERLLAGRAAASFFGQERRSALLDVAAYRDVESRREGRW